MGKRKAEQLVAISCRAPKDLRRQLDRLAAASRQSTSSYVRWLLEDVIPKRVEDLKTASGKVA